PLGVRFQRRPGDLAEESYGAIRGDLVSQVIEDSVIGQHHQLVANFLGNAFQGARGQSLILIRGILPGCSGDNASQKKSDRFHHTPPYKTEILVKEAWGAQAIRALR